MGDYVKSLEDVVKRERDKKNNILLTYGVFDLFHLGHAIFLTKIKEKYPGSLFVNVANDARVKYRKGSGKPINTSYTRALLLSKIEHVDYVTVHPEDKSSPAWQLASIIKPDYMIQSWPWTKEVKKELENILNYLPKLIRLPQNFPGTTHSSKQYKKVLKNYSEEESILMQFRELIPQFKDLLTQKDNKSEMKLEGSALVQSFENLSKEIKSRENVASLVAIALKLKQAYNLSFNELDSFVSELVEKYSFPKSPSSNEQIPPA